MVSVMFSMSLLLVSCCSGGIFGEVVHVIVEQGVLAGAAYVSRNGTKFYSFLGVPYAKPPVGKLRFESPQEPSPWFGVRDAFFYPSICTQNDVTSDRDDAADNIIGEEDCLYLNIYTPSMNPGDNHPVLVWIHGGAFYIGTGSMYQPDYLMDNTVIVVTINYRLGVLGFISVCDETLPGNYGMKDQVMALKWIQQNIHAFGGDASRVTIFGQSSGGASVDFHMRSSLSKDLFHRAISQSGSALSLWAHTPCHLAQERSRAFAVLCGCQTVSTLSLVQCLRKISPTELIKTQLKLRVWNDDPFVLFGVVVEPENVSHGFITRDPWEQRTPVSRVPWMVGFTSGEGGFRVSKFLRNDAEMVSQLDEYTERFLPLIFDYAARLNDEESTRVTKAIKKRYFGDREISPHTAIELVDAITDGFFAHNIIESVLRYPGDVYVYFYDHRNANSFNNIDDSDYDQDLGVGHGDDLLSLFSFPFLFPEKLTGVDVLVSERMISYWINFASMADPNMQEELWTRVKTNDIEYLHITSTGDRMETKLLLDTYEFWKNLLIIPADGPDRNQLKDEL